MSPERREIGVDDQGRRLPIVYCRPAVVEVLWPYLVAASVVWCVPPELLLAMAWEETGCDPVAEGPDGRVGLFGMTAEAAEEAAEADPGCGCDLLDCRVAINLAARKLWHLQRKFTHRWAVIQAWHVGADVVEKDGFQKALDADRSGYLHRVVRNYLWLLHASALDWDGWWPLRLPAERC